MARLVLLLTLLLAGAAAASPRSARLLAQRAPAPPAAPRAQLEDPLLELAPDPYARRVVAREIALGAAMVLGADLASAVFGGGVGFVVWLAAGNPLAAIVAGYLTFLGVNFFLAPAAAAIGAYSVADKGGNNGLLGAILGAGMAQLGYTALFVGTTIALGVLFQVLKPETLAAQGGALAVSLLILAVHWVVLPLGASLGIHWTSPQPDTKPLEPATTPHQAHAQALLRPAPLLALRF